MTQILPKEGTQKRQIYDALMNANGDRVNGRYVLRELYLSQYHRAIWELENAFSVQYCGRNHACTGGHTAPPPRHNCIRRCIWSINGTGRPPGDS
jgi:hypothetical protein